MAAWMRSPTYWFAALVVTIVTIPAGFVIGRATAPTAAARFEQPAPTAIAERAFPGARLSWQGSGTFQVPAQAPPGSYIVAASGSGTFGCSWIRLRAADGKPKSVIDSGAVNRGGFDRFTVGAGDRLLELDGDCAWARQ